MNPNLNRQPRDFGQSMGISIPRQQSRLKKQHTGCPNRRRPAQNRQHHFGKHGLHQKQQKRRQENCGRKNSCLDFCHGNRPLLFFNTP
jgi:hypothetical protein